MLRAITTNKGLTQVGVELFPQPFMRDQQQGYDCKHYALAAVLQWLYDCKFITTPHFAEG